MLFILFSPVGLQSLLLVLNIPFFFPLQNFSAEQGILNMHVNISSWQNKFGSKEFFFNYVIPGAYKYVYAKYNITNKVKT